MKHPDPTETRDELDKISGKMDHGRRCSLGFPNPKLARLTTF